MAVFADEELGQFAEMTRRFVAENYTPEQRLAFSLEAPGYSRAMWSRYAEFGWLALSLAEEEGGAGGGAVELGVLLEASGRALLLEPLLPTLALGAQLISLLGSEKQRAVLLPRIAAGEIALAFAHSEPNAGHERLVVNACATESGLTGDKRFVLHGAEADLLLVSARRADGGLGLYLLNAGMPGLSFETYPSLDGRRAADLRLDNVPAEPLGSGDASAAIDRFLDLATTALCAESMAIVAELNAATLQYARTRKQFGHAIGDFQVVQHRLVDMMTAEQEGWAVTRCAQFAFDDGAADGWRVVSAAKARVDRIARFVSEQAIQLHGGVGMSEELMVGHYVKRLMLNMTMFGDAQWHLGRLGQDL